MKTLILTAIATVGTLLFAAEAQAWTWGRMYGTGYQVSEPPTLNFASDYSSGYNAPRDYDPYRPYYSTPAFNRPYEDFRSNNSYNNYNRAPPYRSSYAPVSINRGADRGN